MPVPRLRFVIGLLAFLLALVALLPAPGLSARGPRFTLGVLRRDGVMIPFASYDGGNWRSRWPTDPETPVPITLADVPRGWWQDETPALKWTAFLTGGGSRPITVTAPFSLRVHCTRRIALRTDYLSVEPPPPPIVQPYPKAGIALAGDSVPIEPATVISLASPTAKAFSAAVAAEVAKAETERANRWARVWAHPANAKARGETPLALELLAGSWGVDGRSRVHYFEGVKSYAGRPSGVPAGKGEAKLATCDYITFAGGWVVGDVADPKTKPSVGAELTNCNREGVVYSLPLGVIRVDGRLFWIMQASSWEIERYDIIEVRQKDVRRALSVWAGACP